MTSIPNHAVRPLNRTYYYTEIKRLVPDARFSAGKDEYTFKVTVGDVTVGEYTDSDIGGVAPPDFADKVRREWRARTPKEAEPGVKDGPKEQNGETGRPVTGSDEPKPVRRRGRPRKHRPVEAEQGVAGGTGQNDGGGR